MFVAKTVVLAVVVAAEAAVADSMGNLLHSAGVSPAVPLPV